MPPSLSLPVSELRTGFSGSRGVRGARPGLLERGSLTPRPGSPRAAAPRAPSSLLTPSREGPRTLTEAAFSCQESILPRFSQNTCNRKAACEIPGHSSPGRPSLSDGHSLFHSAGASLVTSAAASAGWCRPELTSPS